MKEIVRWDRSGQGRVEQYILDEFLDYEDDDREGAIGAVEGWELQILLDMQFEFKEWTLSEPIWPTREYYIYYNYHPTSGFKTKLTGVADDGDIVLRINKPTGGTLSAFWSEVIIFRK